MAEKKINGTLFRTSPLPAPVALPLYLDIVAVSGPLASRLPVMISALSTDDLDNAVVADALVLEAASAVINSAGAQRITDIVRRLLDAVEIERPSGYMRVDFEGDFAEQDAANLIPVLKWALKEQFLIFFPAGAGNGSLTAIRRALLS